MYKCGNKECNFTIPDGAVSYSGSPKLEVIVRNGKCPECEHDLVYINELLEKYNKYKKHMR